MLKLIGKAFWLAATLGGFVLSIWLANSNYWLACLVMLLTMGSVFLALRIERRSRTSTGPGPVTLGDRY